MKAMSEDFIKQTQEGTKVDFEDNIEVQAAIAKVEQYILDKIHLAFPMMTIQVIGDFDQDDDGDLIGFFVDKSDILYHFVIQKDNPNPLLQRVVGEEDNP
jgi:hypothetical protein